VEGFEPPDCLILAVVPGEAKSAFTRVFDALRPEAWDPYPAVSLVCCGVWVPAFAGTTEERAFAGTTAVKDER
jgi:hypothetical protein